MFTLILGLTRYYSKSYHNSNYNHNQTGSTNPDITFENDVHHDNKIQENISAMNKMLFALIFAIFVVICIFNTSSYSTIFVAWKDIDIADIAKLVAAIALSFFLPGYAFLLVSGKAYKVGLLLRFLLAYLFSILITGLTTYVSSLYPNLDSSEIKTCLMIVNLVLLAAFLFCFRRQIIGYCMNIKRTDKFVSVLIARFWTGFKLTGSEILVFGSLLGLLIVSTLYIYGGITIGDQWYHQGRALLFLSGSFNESVLSDLETSYPPFQSALLAGVTSLSGIPLANTYASIAFLNLLPVIAFYYFFSKWVPHRLSRANLLASTFFAVGSGFNWIYFLGPMAEPISSEGSFLQIIYHVWSIVLIQPTNFIFAANPDFSTGLTYIALTAGFVLLGLVNERIHGKLMYIILTVGVSVVGSLAHPEFYYFVIVSSLALVIFIFRKEGNYFYVGMLFALTLVFLFDKILSGNAFVTIFGISLVLLCMFFVLCTWPVFMARQVLNTLLKRKLSNLGSVVPRIHGRINRWQIIISVLVISVIIYIYGISFIISTQSSVEDLKILTAEYNVPWFFYGIKLGIIGFLGLLFLISYIFKKFDKVIFIFGVIVLVAVLAGPYYDEHRLSKFVMVGMIGYASLLVYKIVGFSNNKIPIATFIIPSLVVCASVSALLFIGYNSLVVQTHDYSHNPKKDFPSMAEIGLFDILHSNKEINSSKFNIVSLPNAYTQGGLMTRLQAFSGFPSGKIYESPLTLNTSTLDSFYRLLEYTDAKYIILEKSNGINETGNSEPISFGLIYFPIFYNDGNYTVFEVPTLKAPTSDFAPGIALVYERDLGWVPSEISKRTLLPYNNETFNVKGKTDFIDLKYNKSEHIILHGDKRDEGLTLWTNDFIFDEGINYAQVKFRILSESKDIHNDAGLQWKEGSYQYYASISKKGITVSQKQVNEVNGTRTEFHNPKIEKEDGKLYTLRIESPFDSTYVYVDNILKIQIPRNITANNLQGMSNIGIGSFDNVVEFGPLEVGNSKIKYDKYYYPLSALALSKENYGTYMDGDLSAFSNKIIVLTFDPVDLNDTLFNHYMEYVNEGGRLIILSSENNFKGKFGSLFSLERNSNETVGFSKIIENKNNHAIFSSSGMVNPVHLSPTHDVKVIASYMNESNQPIAPFAVVKNYSNGGSIILVNTEGYYNEISESPRKNFPYLQNITNILDINSSRTKSVEGATTPSTTTPSIRFIGDLQISGNITLKSLSVLFDNENENIPSVIAGQVRLYGENEVEYKVLNKVSLEDLPIEAVSGIRIDSNGNMSLPEASSHNNYFGTSISEGFNMTLNVTQDETVPTGILKLDNSYFPLKDISTIKFYNITSVLPGIQTVALLLKSPEISANGFSVFSAANIDGGFPSTAKPLNITGILNAQLDLVDNYQHTYSDGIRTQYITYLQGLKFEGTAELAKQLKVVTPWEDDLVSQNGIIWLLSVATATGIVLWRLPQDHPK